MDFLNSSGPSRRLDTMSTKRSLGGRPKASRFLVDETALTIEDLFKEREKAQLGTAFQVIGSLRNWTSEWSTDVYPTPRISGSTRVMCWNAGGGSGTLKDDDKLRFLTLVMLQQHVHVACISEGKVRCQDLQATLKRIGMSAHFRAEGKNGMVAWLVRTPTADKIVARLEYEGGRISGLVLAGACRQRTVLLGVYGYTGSSTEMQAALLQRTLWTKLREIIVANQDKKHNIVVLGDLNVLPSAEFTSSVRPLPTAIEDFQDWQHRLGLSNALLHGDPGASIEKGYFTRSRTSRHGAELSLIDHILVTPGMCRGAGVLVLPAGAVGRTDRMGDHDALLADLDCGFQPVPSQEKRPGIKWAHTFSPQAWEELNSDPTISNELDALLIALEREGMDYDSQRLDQIFERVLTVSTPDRRAGHSAKPLPPASEDPIFMAIGRMLGRLRRAGTYVRTHLPAGRGTEMRSRFDRHCVQALVFHNDDRWSDLLADTAAMRPALRTQWCQTKADWMKWLETLAKVRQQLHRMAKHHKSLWAKSRKDFEVAKATQEGRAGKLQRAMNMIFPDAAPGVADNAFWKKVQVTRTDGQLEEVWHFVTDPKQVEEEALRHVQNLFPQPLGWRPEMPEATFPPGYACEGEQVVPAELAEILQGCEPVDFSDVLKPMTIDDFESLLLHQTDDSTPGITGLTYGHLRSMSRKHRMVYLHLVNRFIMQQQCPARWLDVAIALIPKSDGAQGLGAGRPISLIESLMKLATAWVAPRIKAALRAHRKDTDLPEPNLPSGRLHSQQLFDSGEHRGCHQALIMLISVMQGLKLQGKPFYLVSTDVKGAFSGVPTAFAGQRYGSMGISDTTRLFNFLQAIDVNSTIRVRVRHGFSRAVDKGEVGIHQGEVLSPGKYGWSLDPLLVYLDKVARKHKLGIDLASLRLDGQEVPFEGSYSIEAPHGTVVFYTQGGRLVAIAFADDVCLIAKSPEEAQILLHHAQYYYVSASAVLCAPKSVWTGTKAPDPWRIELRLHKGATADDYQSLESHCRAWRRGRAGVLGVKEVPRPANVQQRTPGVVTLVHDNLFLTGLGDSVVWMARESRPLGYQDTLLAYLERQSVRLSRWDVLHRPLHLVNPRTGEREYLKWVPSDQPIKYLGIYLTATLDWTPEYESLMGQLNPLLRQIRAGKKLGLAWDVFVQAAAAKVMGKVTYHTAVVPFGTDRMQCLNNKITAAFMITESASPHQMRCPQPMGLGIPDLATRTAQQRINLALTALHSQGMEGQALRWCLRMVQGATKRFPWEAAAFWVPPAVNGFVEAVTQSLQEVDLLIRTSSLLFPQADGEPDAGSLELGISLEAPVAQRVRVVQHMANGHVVSKATLENLQRQRPTLARRGLATHLLDKPRRPLVARSRHPLWTTRLALDGLEQPIRSVALEQYTSVSDGTGNKVIGTCQVSGGAQLPLLARIHAGDTSVEAELAGLIFSLEAFKTQRAPVEQGVMYSDCQSAMAIYQQTRRYLFNPMASPHGRNSVLQLYLSVFHPFTPESDYQLRYIPAHCDEMDQSLISDEELPIFQGHYQCDELAPGARRIRQAEEVTFFETDFESILCEASTGVRLRKPVEDYLHDLNADVKFHGRMTREHRTDSLGHSWREIPWDEIYRPTTHTPWDSRKAFQPALRNSMDCTMALSQLEGMKRLQPGVLHGAGKSINPYRLRTLGGLASITQAPRRKDKPVAADKCPFCRLAPVDSLQHAMHECLMDAWTAHSGWAKEAVTLMRERFLVSTMTAMLELACPISFTARVFRDPLPKRSRKRTLDSIHTTAYTDIQRVLKERTTPDVADLGAQKWFSLQTCAIAQKEAAGRSAQLDGSCFPATTLMREACRRQKEELQEARGAWERRTGRRLGADGRDDELYSCLRLESRSSDSEQLLAFEPIDRLTLFEQALHSWTRCWGTTAILHSLFPDAWPGIRIVEVDPENPRPNEFLTRHPYSWGYAGWVTSEGRMSELRRYCDLRKSPVLMILEAGTPVIGQCVTGAVLLWPEPKVVGEQSTHSIKRAARLVLLQPCLPSERQRGTPIACSSVPGWLLAWPKLFLDSEPAPLGTRSRRELLLDMSKALLTCPDGQWWWPKQEGALGQAYHTGLVSTAQGQRFVDSLPPRARAHLSSVAYWQRGVLLASILHCRETVATEIKNMWLPEVSAELGQRLYQHARDPPKHTVLVADHHGWQGAPQQQVNLGSVTDPTTGEEVQFVPRRSHGGHQHVTPQRLRDLLITYFASFKVKPDPKGTLPVRSDRAWERLVSEGTCCGTECQTDADVTRKRGMVLLGGHLLCPPCHKKWESHVRKEMGFRHNPRCPRDTDGRCLHCTMEDSSARSKMRHLMVRGQLRDLIHQLFSHLPNNIRGQVANVLFREVRDLHKGQDHAFLISVPVVLHTKLLSLIGWHYKNCTAQLITSVPPYNPADTEPWAMACIEALGAIPIKPSESRQQAGQATHQRVDGLIAKHPTLGQIQAELRPHSGLSTELLRNMQGCQQLYEKFGIRLLPRPQPADWSIRHTSEARCKVCRIFENDRMDRTDDTPPGEAVQNCMSCMSWWHEACMSPADRASLPDMPIENVEDGVAPPWRCQTCVKNDQYAVQRVVDVMRAENGQVYLLMEYLGYAYLEARPEVWLDDKKTELRLNYKEHATDRPNQSMLYCGGALLDAMRSGRDLKGLGLETKLVPRERSLYLISHSSLEKRGLSKGAANAFQMFQGPEHQLVFPFALKNLQCTVDGKSVVQPRYSSGPTLKRGLDMTAEPSLQAIATHLAELTANPASLPVALARAVAGEEAWKGLGLLSGSSIFDIVTALTTFNTQYGPDNWAALLRQELPGLTDDDINWLCSLPEEMEQFEPRPPPASIGLVGDDRQESTIETRSKRGRQVSTENDQDTSGTLRETMDHHTTDQSAPQTLGDFANERLSVHPIVPPHS